MKYSCLKVIVGVGMVCAFNNSCHTQNQLVKRQIIPRDVSIEAKELFNKQLDTFALIRKEIQPKDSFDFDRFYKTASIFYYKNGQNHGLRRHFCIVGGIGCGYQESEQPYNCYSLINQIKISTPELHDFNDSTVWYSSSNYREDTIVFKFEKGFPAVTKLIFFAGNQSSESNWKKFSRPKTIVMYVNEKKYTKLDFKDLIATQTFEFAPILSNEKPMTMKLVITESFKGNLKVVAISDINFDGLVH